MTKLDEYLVEDSARGTEYFPTVAVYIFIVLIMLGWVLFSSNYK